MIKICNLIKFFNSAESEFLTNSKALFLQVTVSSLDMSAVKQKCRLSLNLSRELSVSETLPVKSQRHHGSGARDHYHHSKFEMTDITLSSELFLAPEMMYASLDLPARLAEVTRDLPDHLLKECFSNIIITGNFIISIVPTLSNNDCQFQGVTQGCKALTKDSQGTCES